VAARALFDDLGVTILAATVSLESAPVELLAGNLEAAERELQRDFDVLERMGERYTLSTIAALLGQVFYAQGRYDEAAELAERSREIAAEDDVLSQTLWRALRAKLLAREGDEEPALALAHEAIALARTTDSLDTQGDALLDLCEVLRLSGRQCDERAREAAALYERKGNVVAAARARRVFEARADETAVEA
jgi:tetratricopeptide (TPR) repeat protein